MAPNHGFLLTDASGEPVSRTYQYRKVMKPMLERKRRARINRCLDELKELMTGALQTENENVAKLEKADILELTVRHLHSLRRQNQVNNRTDQTYADRFKAGFRHCAAEVTTFLSGIDQHTSVHVLKHLNFCIKRLDALPQQPQQQQTPPPPSLPPQQTQPQVLPRQMSPPLSHSNGAHHQQSLYPSGFWTQKPSQPRIMPGNFINPLPPSICGQGYMVEPRTEHYNNRDEEIIDDGFVDRDEDCDSVTQIHTPPLSPKIEVVDDAPVWRPW